MAANPSDLLARAIDADRQWDRLMRMGAIGMVEQTGVDRACLTAGDRAARRLLIGWAEAAGASVSVDAAGNLWLRREGMQPDAAPVLTGSHMDTQPRGGRFDGIWGVIAGLEVLSALHALDLRTARPIEVVAWTNEEGGRFAPGCMGSMAWSGHTPLERFAGVRDEAGISFGEALAEQLALESDLPRRALGGRPHGYVEAHIEQGPLLEAAAQQVGVVTGIQGSRWFTVTLQGASAHAGTAPLSLRRDAVQDMLRAIAALNQLTHDPDDVLRFTVGRITVSPNTSNSVAERVTFSIDLRHPDASALRARGDAIAETVRAAVTTTAATVTEVFHAMPIRFDEAVIDAVEQAAAAEGVSHRRMPSGAFHDAQFVAGICPSGMLFVPCRDGISHNVTEYASPGHLAAGTRVLARTLLALAAG
jgi:N-carbamoyl-L-amino-acid hydrolase